MLEISPGHQVFCNLAATGEAGHTCGDAKVVGPEGVLSCNT